MATYKGIQGYSWQKLSSDPTASSDTEGQVWYNSTTGKFKIAIAGAGAWSSGDTLNTTRSYMGAAGASNTAALVYGGDTGVGSRYQDVTESYNGSAWTEVADLNDEYGGGFGFGSQTNAMSATGATEGHGVLTNSETWGGTSWTAAPVVNTARIFGAASGTVSTAGLIFGGWFNPSPLLAVTEKYNGSSWTEVGDLNSARQYFGGSQQGSSTAALAFGGELPGVTANTEKWDGTSWTEVNNLNTARTQNKGAGISTSALCIGGYLPTGSAYQVITESYDGTSWTEVGDLATGVAPGGTTGTTSSAICAGGETPSKTNATEEWADPTYAIKTVTTS